MNCKRTTETHLIVCVDNGPSLLSDKTQSLTVGKLYRTEDDIYEKSAGVKTDVAVVNDAGNEVVYTSNRFVTLQEWRETRMAAIGI